MVALLLNFLVNLAFQRDYARDFILETVCWSYGMHVEARNVRSVVDVFLLWFKMSLRCSEISFMFQWDKRVDAWWSNGDRRITRNATSDVFWSTSRYCAAGWKRCLKMHSSCLTEQLASSWCWHIWKKDFKLRNERRRLGENHISPIPFLYIYV